MRSIKIKPTSMPQICVTPQTTHTYTHTLQQSRLSQQQQKYENLV